MALLHVIQTTFQVPISLDYQQRKDLAELIIQEIQSRTSDGINEKDKAFPDYSKEYINSLDYKIAGKDGTVNLQLSGDMMASIKLITHTPGRITIGFEEGDPNAEKAEGNILGTYGQPKPIKGKARPFLDLPDYILQKLIDQVDSGQAQARLDAQRELNKFNIDTTPPEDN